VRDFAVGDRIVNKFLFGAALACLLPLLAAPAWAGFQEGADAYKKGDFQTAMSEWMPLAQGGDAQAQNAVGALYDNGLGVISDEAEAFKWYSLAANQNYPMAMRNLGTMYATGHGTPYSLPQAQLWLGRAAGAGDQVAAKRLAALPPTVTASGEPVLTPLAPVGSPSLTSPSTSNTGFGSNTGPSSLLAQTPQPAPAAASAPPAATQAAATPAQGTTSAATSAAPAPQPTGALTFPAAQPASADANAASTAATPAVTTASVPAAAAAAEPAAATPVTTTADAAPTATGTAADGWHAFDIGDYKTALDIWQPLAQNGDSNLQVLVGSLYDYGQGVKQNKAEALKWYLMAAQLGSGRGQYAAGALLVKDAKQRNLVEAYKWLTIANATLRGQGGDVAANQAMSLRQQITRDMSKDDIAKAEGLAGSFHAS